MTVLRLDVSPPLSDEQLARIHHPVLETIERVGVYYDRPDVLSFRAERHFRAAAGSQ